MLILPWYTLCQVHYIWIFVLACLLSLLSLYHAMAVCGRSGHCWEACLQSHATLMARASHCVALLGYSVHGETHQTIRVWLDGRTCTPAACIKCMLSHEIASLITLAMHGHLMARMSPSLFAVLTNTLLMEPFPFHMACRPYLPPCLSSAALGIMAFTTNVVLMEETLPSLAGPGNLFVKYTRLRNSNSEIPVATGPSSHMPCSCSPLYCYIILSPSYVIVACCHHLSCQHLVRASC